MNSLVEIVLPQIYLFLRSLIFHRFSPAIARLFVLQDKSQAECIICAEHLGPAVFTCLACNNACCHLACIRKWASHASTCPLCRAELPAAFVPRNPTHGLQSLRFIVADDADADASATSYTMPGLALSIPPPRATPSPASSVAPAPPAGGIVAHIDAELGAVVRAVGQLGAVVALLLPHPA